MTPTQVRQLLQQTVQNLRDSIIAFVRKKDLVLYNNFVDIAGEDSVEVNLRTNITVDDNAKYNPLLSRVSIMIRDEDDQSPTYNGYKNVDSEVSYAVKTDGKLLLTNHTQQSVRVSVFVSADRK